MRMRDQHEGESRLAYLANVLELLMSQTPAGEETIFYDGALCDGLCLAEDFKIAITELTND